MHDGIRHDKLKQWDHGYLWHPFTQMQEWLREDPVVIVRGEGCYLYDDRGRRYLDGVSSLWANIHGHGHREINAAIGGQLARIAHSTLLGLANEPSARLGKKLVEVAPPGLAKVFYSDSGATAVEVALKIAVQYWKLRGEPQRNQFASLTGSYHGDTVGAMSVGYSETFHHFHRELLFGCHRIRPPHIFRYHEGMDEAEALAASLREAEEVFDRHGANLAAVIIEPLMQGAAGMWAQPAAFVERLGKRVRAHGALLIADEVATGFGRTGNLFACDQARVSPDVLCLGKGISGGYLPLAATLTTEEVFSAFLGEYAEFKTFFHGHTYTGNPLACAAGLASLEIFEKERVLECLAPKIAFLQDQLQSEIRPLAHVADLRQKGFMVGIELAEDRQSRRAYPPEKRMAKRVCERVRELGVIIRPLGDVVILMPPLCVSREELARLVEVTRIAIQEVTTGR